MNTKQGTENCSGYILTVEEHTYAILKNGGQWVLFDSHGCLRQSRLNFKQVIAWENRALIVSVGHLEKLIEILLDTHMGHGQCQVMTVNVVPMVVSNSPVTHNRCSGDRVDPVDAAEPQANALPDAESSLLEGKEEDTVALPTLNKEMVRIFKHPS